MTVEFGREVDPQMHALALGFSRALDEMAGVFSAKFVAKLMMA